MSKSADTIWVKLQNHWFDPNSKFWDPGVYEMPADVVDLLPSSAVVQKEDGTPDDEVNEARAKKQSQTADQTKAAVADAAVGSKTVGDTKVVK